MAVYGPDDYVLGSDGQYYDPLATPPPGVKLNGMPTQTATPGSPGGPQLSTPQGGQLITTPNSSTGQPIRQAPSASSFPAPATGAPNTLTPSSSTGAPAPGIRTLPTVNPMTLPIGGGLATGVGVLSRFPTPTAEETTNRLNNPPLANDPWLIHSISKMLGLDGQPAASPSPQTQTQTKTAPPDPTGSSVTLASGQPPPPGYPPLPPVPPPGLRGSPRPVFQSAPPPRAPPSYNLGYGGQTPAAAAAPPAAPSPMFTTIDRPNADVAGGRSVAGQLAPQYFNPAREPGGPAQMGALDLSGLFNHPAVAAAAAAHPAVQGALAQQNAQQQQAPPRARAPVVQQQSTARKVFGNPASWQYPNMPF